MKFRFVAALLLSGSLLASARTWTSADGEMELEGDFKSFNDEASEVTILVEGEEIKFDLGKLSDEDQAFVKSQGEVNITTLLQKATLHQVVDGEVKEVKFEADPKYYLLYFSASW